MSFILTSGYLCEVVYHVLREYRYHCLNAAVAARNRQLRTTTSTHLQLV